MIEHPIVDVVDPETGEVLRVVDTDAIAREFVAASAAWREALDEARPLGVRVEELAMALRDLLPPEGRADGGSAWVVMEPASRPAQRVDRQGAERHREELLGLGLGRESMDFHAPTAAEIRAERPRVIAAGIPLVDLLPEPVAGPPTPRIVPKEDL